MKQYLDVLENVATNGRVKGNRTSVGTKYLFSEKFRCNLQDGFPLLTTKKINPRSVLGELFGFLKGATTVEEFQELGCNIWNPWGLEIDYYNLKQSKISQLVEELAIKRNVSVDAVYSDLEDLKYRWRDWCIAKDKLILDIANGTVETAPDETQEKLQELLNDHLAKEPPSVNQYLTDNGIELYYKDIIHHRGDLGPIYGEQWLNWVTSTGDVINQIKRVANQIENHPLSRRIILTAWNPEFIPDDHYPVNPVTGKPNETSHDQIQSAILSDKQALPPCHLMVIIDIDVDDVNFERYLNMEVIMRSTDVPIGLPYNIASYAFLMHLIADQFGLIPNELVIEMTNCHIYEDQLELVKEQLARTPGKLPTLKKIPADVIFDQPETLTVEKIDEILAGLEGYEPQPFIKYPVAV